MASLVCSKSTPEVSDAVMTAYTEPHGEPGIVPMAHICDWCGDWFVVKGVACESRGKALDCFRYKQKNK